MSTLDADIDALARRIERQIQRNEARLADLPDFDRDRESSSESVSGPDELFL